MLSIEPLPLVRAARRPASQASLDRLGGLALQEVRAELARLAAGPRVRAGSPRCRRSASVVGDQRHVVGRQGAAVDADVVDEPAEPPLGPAAAADPQRLRRSGTTGSGRRAATLSGSRPAVDVDLDPVGDPRAVVGEQRRGASAPGVEPALGLDPDRVVEPALDQVDLDACRPRRQRIALGLGARRPSARGSCPPRPSVELDPAPPARTCRRSRSRRRRPRRGSACRRSAAARPSRPATKAGVAVPERPRRRGRIASSASPSSGKCAIRPSVGVQSTGCGRGERLLPGGLRRGQLRLQVARTARSASASRASSAASCSCWSRRRGLDQRAASCRT